MLRGGSIEVVEMPSRDTPLPLQIDEESRFRIQDTQRVTLHQRKGDIMSVWNRVASFTGRILPAANSIPITQKMNDRPIEPTPIKTAPAGLYTHFEQQAQLIKDRRRLTR
jgi:hypothetical protein